MPKIKKSFYDDFKHLKNEKKDMSNQIVENNKENIVFEEKNKTIVKILSFLSEIFSGSFKILLFIILSILISIALTVICNSNIRNYILSLLG